MVTKQAADATHSGAVDGVTLGGWVSLITLGTWCFCSMIMGLVIRSARGRRVTHNIGEGLTSDDPLVSLVKESF